jgi:hypothetical protein
MIIGQVLINGVSFSCHRYSETKSSIPQVKERLSEMVAAEKLGELGTVEVRVHSQNGLDRLMSALLGLDD